MRDALIYALGVAVSPVAIGTVLLILSGPAATVKALSFATGWVSGVAIAAVSFALVVEGLDLTDSGPAWIGVPEIVVGVAFLAVAARLWARPRPSETPAWLDAVDRFTRLRAATLGIVLSAANPKVLALALGAALSLAQDGAEPKDAAVGIALFTAVGSAGALVPIAAYAAFPDRAAVRLRQARRWLTRHERVVLIVLALAIGAVFVRDGIRLLAS